MSACIRPLFGRLTAAVFVVSFLSLGLSVSAHASDPDVVPFSNKFPVEILIDEGAPVYPLVEMGIDIDAAGEGWIRAYVSPSEVQLIELLGYTVKRIPNQALRMWRTLQEQPRERKEEWDDYHNNAEIETYLAGVAADHPDIVRYFSVGQSVLGRDLWIAKITDNPDVQEDEPEFKYISTMHGDEPVGTENCLRLIELLTDNYDSPTPDPDLERLVNEVELWILPMMNPDGNYSGSRYNAHGVDLNRSFPDWFWDPNNTPVGREPEIATVMIFSDTMSFDLSANFHTGALVVNYPWDNRSARAPDDDLYIFMSESYSVHNPPMWNSSTFYHGITNGWDWYEVHGSMQDWNYSWMYNKEVTIELNNVKWPSATLLPQLWDDNDESMPAYIENCLRGVRGIVTDASTGDPLLATVEVEGNVWIDRTDPDVGDYHRLLLPGTYTLTFSADDHLPQTFVGVEVADGDATVLDVQLGTAAQIEVTGTVTTDSRAPLMAKVEIFYHASGNLADSTTSSPADGSYTLNVSPAEYDIRAWTTGYAPGQQFANIQSDTTFNFVLEPVSGIILVIDDDEGKRLLEKKDGFEVETVVKGERESAADLAADLTVLGYEVVEETAFSTDPLAWPTYDMVVWSCGANTSPVTSLIRRGNLIDFVDGGGKLLIEGGELAYDSVGYPRYPNFADSVLHVDDWNGDQVGNLWLVPAQQEHLLATDPNPLPGTITIDYSGWGAQDAAHPTGGAYIVYGNTGSPADAGVLVYDGAKSGESGRVTFFSFAYNAILDATEARDLLQNTVVYMTSEMTAVDEVAMGHSEMKIHGIFPNPFNPLTTISFSLSTQQRVHLAVYDVQGRLVNALLDGVLEAGPHEVAWDARDGSGQEIASGIYFCRLTSGRETDVRKMVKLN
jgi:hypothetical protein